MLKTEKLLDISQTMSAELFKRVRYPWEVLPLIGKFIGEVSALLPKNEYIKIDKEVWVSKYAEIAPSASITGPAIIQKNTQIRHCAFIRGNAIVGENSVVGNSTELKNVVLFNGVQVPHYNYIGDSVLGYKSHFGAGAITSNVRSDKANIDIKTNHLNIHTNLRKFGAIIGDFAEIGCNAVLNPGVILGRNTTVYPTSMVRGVVRENSIFKNTGIIIEKS